MKTMTKKKQQTPIQALENTEKSSIIEASKSDEFPADQELIAELPVRQLEDAGSGPTQEQAEVIASDQTSGPPEAPSTEETQLPSKIEKPKPLTMISLAQEIKELRQALDQQAQLISKLLEKPTPQRMPPASTGKISVRDKETGRTFVSKNSAYKTLLKEGALDDLVKQGIFGDVPSKNGWGCYAMFRALPNRFEFFTAEAKDATTEIPQ
jgi:hypothetical protein